MALRPVEFPFIRGERNSLRVTRVPRPSVLTIFGRWPTTRPSARRPRLQHLRGCYGASPLGSCRPFPGSPQCLRLSACTQRFGYLDVSRYRAYSRESLRATLSSPYFASAFLDASGIPPERRYSGRRSLTLAFRLRLRGANLPTSYSRYSSVRGHLMGPSWTKRSSSPGKGTRRMHLPGWMLLACGAGHTRPSRLQLPHVFADYLAIDLRAFRNPIICRAFRDFYFCRHGQGQGFRLFIRRCIDRMRHQCWRLTRSTERASQTGLRKSPAREAPALMITRSIRC